jgi:hypothetical protein
MTSVISFFIVKQIRIYTHSQLIDHFELKGFWFESNNTICCFYNGYILYVSHSNCGEGIQEHIVYVCMFIN